MSDYMIPNKDMTMAEENKYLRNLCVRIAQQKIDPPVIREIYEGDKAVQFIGSIERRVRGEFRHLFGRLYWRR